MSWARRFKLLTVPSRRITGRVVDAETERPITEASLTVESVSDDTRRNRNVLVQPNGTFVLSGISEGQYVISASAPSYLPGERLELNVREGDGDQQLDLSLLRGVPIVVRVVDSRNAPISRATVITGLGPAGDVTDLTKTDENGLATIPVAERSQKIIYVIPSGGSFAVSRLTADQSESGLRVVVPDAPATLHLQTRSTAGEPIPGVSFALRYAGGELPVGVMRTLARVRGVTFVTDSTGKVTITGLPVGAYALGWKQAGHAGLLGDGWQGVELVAGETTVTQTFSLPDTGRGATP